MFDDTFAYFDLPVEVRYSERVLETTLPTIMILEEAPLRETRVPVSASVFAWLKVPDGKVFADYEALYNKSPGRFPSAKAIKDHVEHVLSNPTLAMEASKKEYTLLVRRNGADSVVVVEFELKGGKYRVKSVHTFTEGQLETKIKNLQAMGGRVSTNPANPIPQELRSLIQGADTPSNVPHSSQILSNSTLPPNPNAVKRF